MNLERQFWMEVRHSLLILLGAIEKALQLSPTTKECREIAKREVRTDTDD